MGKPENWEALSYAGRFTSNGSCPTLETCVVEHGAVASGVGGFFRKTSDMRARNRCGARFTNRQEIRGSFDAENDGVKHDGGTQPCRTDNENAVIAQTGPGLPGTPAIAQSDFVGGLASAEQHQPQEQKQNQDSKQRLPQP